MKRICILIGTMILSSLLFAQEKSFDRSSHLTTGFSQIKESANYGLVFSGPAIHYGLKWTSITEKRVISYDCDLGAGVLFSKGIPGLNFEIKPVDLEYLFAVKARNTRFFLGPSVKDEYNYSLYPDLQAGFDYWFTTISIGVIASYNLTFYNTPLDVKANITLAGLTSRQPSYRDPYFYDLGFNHAVKHLHRDLKLTTLENLNEFYIEIIWKTKPGSPLSFGYLLDYSGYNADPEFTFVSHSIKFIFNKK